jgi:type I restriction enzyme S subunit
MSESNKWTPTPFGSLVERLVNGGTPPTEVSRYWSGDIPWITGADFRENGLTEFRRYVSGEAVRETSTNVITERKLLIVTRTGVGKLAIASCDVAISQDITGVYPSSEKVDTGFLYHRMKVGLEELKKLNQGTSINGIIRGDLISYEINLPPLPQQRRIAEILSTVDDAIEATEALIAKQQQIKQGLMHDLFTRGVWTAESIARARKAGLTSAASAKPGQLRPSRETAPELYKESPLGWIPKDWEVKSLLDCAAKTSGATTIGPFGSDLVASDYRSEGVPVVFVRDVKENAFFWKSQVYVSPEKAMDLAAHSVRSGDLLATKMGLPPCVACLYPDDLEPGIITADIVRLRPDLRLIEPTWLSSAVNSDAVKKQVLTITAGVTRPKITLSDFRKLKIPCPPLEEQGLAVKLIDLEKLRGDAEQRSVDNLKKQKQGLMQDLLTGRVSVS